MLTARGLAAVYDKFNAAAYGRCPRVFCEGQAVLPCGLSDLPRKAGVALFCPRCNDVYQPKSTKSALLPLAARAAHPPSAHPCAPPRASLAAALDGAFFGTTLPHLFLMTYPSAIPPPPAQIYVPRVFGFRVRRDLAALQAADGGAAPARAPAPAPAAAALTAALGSLTLQPSGLAGVAPVRAVGVAGAAAAPAVAAAAAAAAAPLLHADGSVGSQASPPAGAAVVNRAVVAEG